MNAHLFEDSSRGAVLSPDGLYRYDLWRRWESGPLLAWVMLNPSTADADLDDQTVLSCTRITRHHGYAGFTIRNLFAYRTRSPKVLWRAPEPVGPENDRWLSALAEDRFSWPAIVAAWGAVSGGPPWARHRVDTVRRLLEPRTLLTLEWPENRPGPGPVAPHALYMRAASPLVPYGAPRPMR